VPKVNLSFILFFTSYTKTKGAPSPMDYKDIPIVEVPEPRFRIHRSTESPPSLLDPGEVMHENRDKEVISGYLNRYPKIIVVSCIGMLGCVMRLCQSLNHALFHLWLEDLAIHSTEIFSYHHDLRPVNVGILFKSISSNGFILKESFARHAGSKIINACSFSFEYERDEDRELTELPPQMIDAFEKNSFTRANITCSLHQSKEGELFRVDVVDLDGHVSAGSEDAHLLFAPEGYTLSIPLPVHS